MPPTLPAAESTLDAIAAASRTRACPRRSCSSRRPTRIDRVVPTDGYFLAADRPRDDAVHRHRHRPRAARGAVPADTGTTSSSSPTTSSSPTSPAAGARVADLHDATGGRPERSPRFRQYSAATGFRAEVRSRSRSAARPGASGSSTGSATRALHRRREGVARAGRGEHRARPAPGDGRRAGGLPRAGARPGHRAARRRRARRLRDARGDRLARRARPGLLIVRRRRPAAALPRPRLRGARARGARGRRAADPLAPAHPQRRLAADARRGRWRAPGSSRSSSSRRSRRTSRR